jgi:hypothetical protein
MDTTAPAGANGQRKRREERAAAHPPRQDNPPAESYEPTPSDISAAAAYQARSKRLPPFIAMKVENKPSGPRLSPDHADAHIAQMHLMEALGTTDPLFYASVMDDLADLANRLGQEVSQREFNALLAMVRSVEPRDQLETMLAVQMAAIHAATIRTARMLRHSDMLPQFEAASTALNKLARTFAAQIEALKRYRSTGEQSVRVTHQHVTVNNQGGQAVVAGEMVAGGGGTQKSEGQSLEPSGTSQSGPALLGHVEALGLALPGAGREGQAGVSMPRGKGGRAEG